MTDVRRELLVIMLGLALVGGGAIGLAVSPLFVGPPRPVPCWVPEDAP